MLAHDIKSYQDLVTSHEAVRDGFLEQALRKVAAAEPYIAQAIHFQNRLQEIPDLTSLIDATDIREELTATAGFSDKSAHNFSASELEEALFEVLSKIEANSRKDWRSEIVFRFLLTRGDSLGGAMRNIIGAAAQEKFSGALITALAQERTTPMITRASTGKIQRISWTHRVLMFDRTSRFVGNNIDVILTQQPSEDMSDRSLLSNQGYYLACGELKGGIDPAGADEHWKTATRALDRIREKFAPPLTPKLFFVGAAIEDSTAKEIFAQLESGALTTAANLNIPEQIANLADWLINL